MFNDITAFLNGLPKTTLYLGIAGVAIGLLLLSHVLRTRRRNVDPTPKPPRKSTPPAPSSTEPVKPVAKEGGDIRTSGETTIALRGEPAQPVAAATVSQPPTIVAPAQNLAVAKPLFQSLGKRVDVDGPLPRVEAGDLPFADRSDRMFGATTPVLAAFLPDSAARREQARRELQNAGYFGPHALENLAAIRYFAMIAPVILCGLGMIFGPPQFEIYFLAGLIVLPILGWALPRLYVKGQAAERTAEIEKGMPDMLDMLNMCVSQGMTVQTGLARVNEELHYTHPALHKELQIVTDQARVGSLNQALDNFSKRVDVAEVHSFANLIGQTERMGTSVSQGLAEYSDSMRAGLRQRADEKGNSAAFKLLFPTVLCLMPAVYMFLLGPSIVEMTKFLGRDDNTLEQATTIMEQTGRANTRGL